MASAAVLPPVTEALNLLDVSFVNNEWHGTPATIRRSVQILVDHISVQSVQLSRVEDILAAFGNPTQQGGTVWSKLATKADLSRMEKLEAQVDTVLNECSQLRSLQAASSHARDEVMSRVELLRDHVGSLEARLGVPYMQDSSTGGLDQFANSRRTVPGAPGLGSGYASPSKLALVAAGGLGPSAATGSVLDRLSRLERRADALTEISAKTEDDSSMLLSRLREMEPRMEVQLNHLRGDIKQALAMAAANSRLEADNETTTRIKEAERRLLTRIQSVESTLEGKVAAVSSQTGATLSSELDKRVNTLYEHVNTQVQRLREDLDHLSRDKIDLTALEHYSKRISALFEDVAGGLADEVAGLASQLRGEVAGLGRDMQAAHERDKAMQDGIRAEMEGMRQLSTQVKEAMGAVQETVSATPRLLDDARLMMQQVMGDQEQLQKAVTGLNSAMASTSSALELQAHKVGQLSHKVNGVQQDVGSLKDTIYGNVQAAAAAAAAASGGRVAEGGGAGSAAAGASGNSLVSKLASLDRAIAEMTASIGTKAEDSLARDLERRVAALSRQQDITSEGLRSLSATAFKRSDEHASAIQRLTLAVSGNLEERPTTTAVKHLVETAALEVRERCDSALGPLWDAVRILQTGLRDASGELKAVGASVNGLQQVQADSRTKQAADRSSIMASLRKALDEEVTSLRHALEARVGSVEVDVRQACAQLDLHAQLQDKLTQLSTAVEEQLAAQVSAWRTGNQQLRSELVSRSDSAVAGLAARLEGLEVAARQHSEDLEAMNATVTSRPTEAAVRELAASACRAVVKQELVRQADKEEARWQLWLEEHMRTHERLTTQGDVEAVVEGASRQLRQELDVAASTRADELRRTVASVRGEMDGRLRATASRLEVVEMRMQDMATGTSTYATKKDLEELSTAAVAARADRAGVEARLRQLAGDVEDQAEALVVLRGEAVTRSELATELARKVDLSTFLARVSARAATATAGALVGGSVSPSSSPRPRTEAAPPVRSAGGGASAATAAAVARAAERLRLSGALA